MPKILVMQRVSAEREMALKCGSLPRDAGDLAGVPEHGGMLLWQIFLSRNCAAVNIVHHSQNADTEAFWQISSYYKKLPYTQNLANWFSV